MLKSKVKALHPHESVTEKTFVKWPMSKCFTYEVNEETNKLENLRCVVCSEQWPLIKKEATKRGLKGQVLVSVKQYIDGVQYVHRSNVDRHCKSGSLHEFALMQKKRNSRPNISNITNDINSDVMTVGENVDNHNERSVSCEKQGQRAVDVMLKDQSTDTYMKLFNTALHLVIEEEPFTKFPKLIELQRKNGLKLLSGKTNRTFCTEMVKTMAEIVREDMKEIIKNANFISGKLYSCYS